MWSGKTTNSSCASLTTRCSATQQQALIYHVNVSVAKVSIVLSIPESEPLRETRSVKLNVSPVAQH